MKNTHSFLFILATLLTFTACPKAPQSGQSQSESQTTSQACETPDDPQKIAAEVYGKTITEGELEQAISTDLYELRNNIYRLKERQLDEMIGKIVLEKEAARLKLSVNELMDKEVKRRSQKVTQRDINDFYEKNKDHLKGTKDQFKDRIQSFLERERFNEAYQKYVDQLKKRARVKTYLAKPERPRVELSLTPAPTKGKEDAKVKIVEFSDFECPFCGGLIEKLDNVLNKYKRHVSLTFKAYPLSMHKNAPLAHQASLCAHDQGKFWPYHDILFKNQKQLERSHLEDHAGKLKLDLQKFKQCLDSGEKFAKVQKEMQEGNQAGVRSTPTLFINGKILVGNVPQEAIEEVVNEELRGK